MSRTKLAALAIVAGAITPLGIVTAPVDAHTTGIHDNCTNFNKRYPHGVGTMNAHDRGSSDPVTNFKRSNTIYWAAENHNGTLDRDNDRVVCEKH
jgi:hypothetical protein